MMLGNGMIYEGKYMMGYGLTINGFLITALLLGLVILVYLWIWKTWKNEKGDKK